MRSFPYTSRSLLYLKKLLLNPDLSGMKRIACCLVCLSVFIFINAHAQGFLKASGGKIVNEKNENVLLRGMGLGGWMLQEGYMLKLEGNNPQFSVRNRIVKLLGEEKAQEFYDVWLNNFTTKTDIDSMHAWGFNSVRLPMHYNLYTLAAEQETDSVKQTWLTKGFALTDSLLNWCKANNMYLILDLHAAPGGQGNDINISDRDTTKPSLWQSNANKIKMIALWKKLAERYKDEPFIGAYDIINEPNWGFDDPVNDKHGLNEEHNKPLRELMVDITNAIRSVDKKHIIIIEGNGWGNNYKGIFPLWDDNMVLSFHKYWSRNDVKSIQHILDARSKYKVPVWLGETGENSNTWFTDAVHLFETNNIGWSWWPLKKLGNNNPLQIKANENYTKLADYWNSKTSNTPSATDAYNGLMAFARSTNINSNLVHTDVTDAMFRQPYSNKTIPFKQNIIGPNDSVINAVDYDLGKNGFAYYDKDTGNYYISGDGSNVGNKGHTYRNDGVDIYEDVADSGNYYIGSIEKGEWIQYAINVTQEATYNLKTSTSSENSSGKMSVSVDDKPVQGKISIASTGSLVNWKKQHISSVHLAKGIHIIKVYFDEGGFNLKALVVVK